MTDPITHSALETGTAMSERVAKDSISPSDMMPHGSRRGLLRNFGIGAAALGIATTGFYKRADAQAAITDEDILNFALNLEYLEAEYYLRAVYGKGLPYADVTGTGTLGLVSGGAKVPFKNKFIADYAREIANDEFNHVKFLRSALGSAAVARPPNDQSTSFTVLGHAAGVVPAGTKFDPFASEEDFLLGSFIFEDVGVTAYHGAAADISSKAYLTAAAGILAVEAYHASEVRLLIFQNGTTLSQQADKISALRADLSGAADDQGPLLPGGVPNIVPTDNNSLAFARTPTQVLNIVYGGGSANNYLFFPEKMNGTIA
jgi:hypothetical protein